MNDGKIEWLMRRNIQVSVNTAQNMQVVVNIPEKYTGGRSFRRNIAEKA